MIQRLFMFVVFLVGLALCFAGYTMSRASLVSNYPTFFGAEQASATVTDPGRCNDTAEDASRSKPAISKLNQVFQVKLDDSSEIVEVIARGCYSFVVGDRIEVLNEGPNIRGEKMWSLRRSGLSGLDSIGPLLFVFGLMAIYFGMKRVLFGFPKPSASVP